MQDFPGVDLAKVDVDVLSELAVEHEVTSIPAVVAFVNGTRTSSFVGTKDKQFLVDFVKEVMDHKV